MFEVPQLKSYKYPYGPTIGNSIFELELLNIYSTTNSLGEEQKTSIGTSCLLIM